MTILNVDYLTKDYEGFLQYMKSKISTHLPEWTDNSETDFGIVMLELLSYGLHILSYYQDKSFNESFLSTAKTRKSVVNLCRFLGYELEDQQPAKATLTFTKEDINTEITVPTGYKVSTNPSLGQQIIFETNSALTIPVGTLTGQVEATQGVTYENVLIGKGTGVAGQRIIIPVPYIYLFDNVLNSTAITIGTGDIENLTYWTKVDNFLTSESSDKHFVARITSNYLAEIIFGDGTSGELVTTGSNIYSTYKISNGIQGNVAASKLTFLYDDISGIASVINSNPASGGTDYESIDNAKKYATSQFFAAERCVTKYDVAACAVNATPDENGKYCVKAYCNEEFDGNGNITIYVAPTGYGVASATLLSNVSSYISERIVLNNIITTATMEYVLYNVSAVIYVPSNYVNIDVSTEAEALIDSVCDCANYEVGQDVLLGSLYKEFLTSMPYVTDIVIALSDIGGNPISKVDMSGTNAYKLAKLNNSTVAVTGGI